MSLPLVRQYEWPDPPILRARAIKPSLAAAGIVEAPPAAPPPGKEERLAFVGSALQKAYYMSVKESEKNVLVAREVFPFHLGSTGG
jgi:hypothetical protein